MVTEEPNNLTDSIEKLDLLLKKIAMFENLGLMGKRVSDGKPAEKIKPSLLQDSGRRGLQS